jgi:hypothetical protein
MNVETISEVQNLISLHDRFSLKPTIIAVSKKQSVEKIKNLFFKKVLIEFRSE